MNIKGEFREQLLEYEVKKLLNEGVAGDLFKKSGEILAKILKLKEKRAIALKLFANFKQANIDFKAGKLDPKNPNYDKEADKRAWDTIYDIGKLIAFGGINTLLNFFTFGSGFAVGFAFMLFRKFIPQKIIKYFMLAAEEGITKLKEVAALFEDMDYIHATKDQYSIGT